MQSAHGTDRAVESSSCRGTGVVGSFCTGCSEEGWPGACPCMKAGCPFPGSPTTAAHVPEPLPACPSPSWPQPFLPFVAPGEPPPCSLPTCSLPLELPTFSLQRAGLSFPSSGLLLVNDVRVPQARARPGPAFPTSPAQPYWAPLCSWGSFGHGSPPHLVRPTCPRRAGCLCPWSAGQPAFAGARVLPGRLSPGTPTTLPSTPFGLLNLSGVSSFRHLSAASSSPARWDSRARQGRGLITAAPPVPAALPGTRSTPSHTPLVKWRWLSPACSRARGRVFLLI